LRKKKKSPIDPLLALFIFLVFLHLSHIFPRPAYSSTLKLEAINAFETLIPTYQAVQSRPIENSIATILTINVIGSSEASVSFQPHYTASQGRG
jgi:hypothetical protein